MLFDLCARKDFGAEGVDFFHRRVDVVALVCGPGGARGAAGEQAAVVTQSEADTHGHGYRVEESVDQAFAH